MAENFTSALNATHGYLNSLGGKFAPNKSFYFASHAKAKKWLEEIVWGKAGGTIKVIADLRYLGAHITTRNSVSSPTLEERFDKALMQLKRLSHCSAGNEAKIKAILGKVYVGALYGAEAARLAPAKVAKLKVQPSLIHLGREMMITTSIAFMPPSPKQQMT